MAEKPMAPIGTEFPPLHPVYSDVDVITNNTLDEFIGPDASLEKRLAWAVRMRSISETNRQHEQWYRIMFGSQLRALQRLSKLGTAPAEMFRPFFDEAAKNPETASIHEGRNFEEWGKFLLNIGYVQQVADTENVAITPLGLNFLMWMIEHKVNDWRPG